MMVLHFATLKEDILEKSRSGLDKGGTHYSAFWPELEMEIQFVHAMGRVGLGLWCSEDHILSNQNYLGGKNFIRWPYPEFNRPMHLKRRWKLGIWWISDQVVKSLRLRGYLENFSNLETNNEQVFERFGTSNQIQLLY